jgi:hypothetical protein
MYNPEKQTWLNPSIEYLFDKSIYEYDIRDAGFSIIKEHHLLSDDRIKELEKLGKDERHIRVGLLQREDQIFSRILQDKFTEARQNFVYGNNLDDNSIISVKKDAFFVTKVCDRTKFGEVEFVIKNKYTSYIRFSENHNIECYYNEEQLDIKGLSTISMNKHRLYLIAFLQKFFRMIERRDAGIKRTLIDFVMRYKRQELEEPYYLEFNSRSYSIDPGYNYMQLIVPMVQIILGENI